VQNKTIFWLTQILPPICLLPLVVVPIDLGTMIFWGPAYMFGMGSFVNIISFVVRWLMRSKVKVSLLVRPILTICVLVVATLLVSRSVDSAIKFAHRKAIEINKQCNQNECPQFIEGWRRESFACDTLAGDLATYRVKYRVSDDLHEFTLDVRISIDHFYRITGGSGKELGFDTNR